jgi:hypothetical protein
MPTDLLSQYAQARLKITRADNHIAKANVIISSLPDLYTLNIVDDPSGKQAVKYDLHNSVKIATDLALVVGDALHNLRTALDYAWIATIAKHAPSVLTDRTKFPIYPTCKELKGALNGVNIDSLAPELYKLIVDRIKPYQSGNDAIYTLHRLDISDKHHLLIPLMSIATIEGIVLEDDKGNIQKCGVWAFTRPGPYFVDLEGKWQIKDKGKLQTTVVFKDESIEGQEVSGLLFSISIATINVLNFLEYFYQMS